MITMGRGEFKAYMCNVVDHCDEASYLGLSQLFLTACGVIDKDGNLTKAYANSPFWSVEGGKLKPSANVELLNQLSPEVKQIVEAMDGQHNPEP